MLYVLFIYIIHGKVERKNISQFVDADKMAFVGIAVDWCATCKFNKITASDIIMTLELFHIKNVIAMRVTLIPKMMKYMNS